MCVYARAVVDCVGYRFPKSMASWLELKLGIATDTCDIVREVTALLPTPFPAHSPMLFAPSITQLVTT